MHSFFIYKDAPFRFNTLAWYSIVLARLGPKGCVAKCASQLPRVVPPDFPLVSGHSCLHVYVRSGCPRSSANGEVASQLTGIVAQHLYKTSSRCLHIRL